ncbi:hypothetical protein CMI38_07105 [Candidatus Pacearchaeota archaeon]|nr:hypothetical protein [Candidatus Pacearchaeota archaeon]|tara:strand:+ start:711 stop:1838 length:1128 start_codon:yes stop_codon:yes gene_type:complete
MDSKQSNLWLTKGGNSQRTYSINADTKEEFIAFISDSSLNRLSLKGKLLSNTKIEPERELRNTLSAGNNYIVGIDYNNAGYLFDINGDLLSKTNDFNRSFNSFEPLITNKGFLLSHAYADEEEPSIHVVYDNGEPVSTQKLELRFYNFDCKQKWRFNCNAGSVYHPVINKDGVFVASDLGLLKINVDTGKVDYLLNEFNEGTIFSSPIAVNNKVYISTGIKNWSVFGLSLEGKVIETFENESANNNSSYLNGIFVSNTHDEKLYANKVDHTLFRKEIHSSNNIALTPEFIYVAQKNEDWSTNMIKLSYEGEIQEESKILSGPMKNFSINKDQIILGTNGAIRSLDSNDLSRNWNYFTDRKNVSNPLIVTRNKYFS